MITNTPWISYDEEKPGNGLADLFTYSRGEETGVVGDFNFKFTL